MRLKETSREGTGSGVLGAAWSGRVGVEGAGPAQNLKVEGRSQCVSRVCGKTEHSERGLNAHSLRYFCSVCAHRLDSTRTMIVPLDSSISAVP